MEIIGICGGSCSGKTTLVAGLTPHLTNLTIIHFDDFFVGMDKLNGREVKNWEDPNLYRLDDYEDTLRQIRQNKKVEIEANSRESKHEGLKTRVIKPNDLVIVEGFLIFYKPELIKYFDKKIYLDIPEEEIIRRRYERIDKKSWFNSDQYIQKTLIKEHRKIVLPQKKYMDLVIDATKTPDDIINEVLFFIIKNSTNQARRLALDKVL